MKFIHPGQYILRLVAALGPACVVAALVANQSLGTRIMDSPPWTALTLVGSIMSTAAMSMAANRLSKKEVTNKDIIAKAFIEEFKKAAADRHKQSVPA